MKNATATTKGWVCNKTGELLKSRKMTQAECDQLNGVQPKPAKVEAEAPKPKKKKKKTTKKATAKKSFLTSVVDKFKS